MDVGVADRLSTIALGVVFVQPSHSTQLRFVRMDNSSSCHDAMAVGDRVSINI